MRLRRQLLKPTIKCDKLQYKCRDIIVHQAQVAKCSPTHDKCMEVLHISYTMCTRGLPDICTLGPWACCPRASGVYIRQTTHAHGITIKYTTLIPQMKPYLLTRGGITSPFC